MSAFLRSVGKVSNAEAVSLKTRFGRRRVGGKLFRNLGPLRAVSASTGGDPYFANVVSLLHFDGTDASTTFTDAFRTWTAVGNAQIDTAQSVFGGASGLSDGTGDSISTASSANFDFGSGDFTVECRMRFVATIPIGGGYDVIQDGANDKSISFNGTDVKIQVVASVGSVYSSVLVYLINTWYAWAVSRVGNTIYFFQDGVGIGSADVTGLSFNLSGSGTYIFGQQNGNNSSNGHIDEMRVTKGVGRYSANYTVDTAAFPDS